MGRRQVTEVVGCRGLVLMGRRLVGVWMGLGRAEVERRGVGMAGCRGKVDGRSLRCLDKRKVVVFKFVQGTSGKHCQVHFKGCRDRLFWKRIKKENLLVIEIKGKPNASFELLDLGKS